MHVNYNLDLKSAPEISFEDFLKVDIRVGQIISAEVFKEAKKPAFILKIDFGGTIGEKKSSAQITEHYDCKSLIGKQVAAVINFPPKQIGPIKSEVLVVGFSDDKGKVVLFSPDQKVPNGSKLH